MFSVTIHRYTDTVYNLEYPCPECGRKVIASYYNDYEVTNYSLRICFMCSAKQPDVVDLMQHKFEKISYHTTGKLPYSNSFLSF